MMEDKLTQKIILELTRLGTNHLARDLAFDIANQYHTYDVPVERDRLEKLIVAFEDITAALKRAYSETLEGGK